MYSLTPIFVTILKIIVQIASIFFVKYFYPLCGRNWTTNGAKYIWPRLLDFLWKFTDLQTYGLSLNTKILRLSERKAVATKTEQLSGILRWFGWHKRERWSILSWLATCSEETWNNLRFSLATITIRCPATKFNCECARPYGLYYPSNGQLIHSGTAKMTKMSYASHCRLVCCLVCHKEKEGQESIQKISGISEIAGSCQRKTFIFLHFLTGNISLQ